MKVKELKRIIENLDDDTPIVYYVNDMERNGYLEQVYISVKKMEKTTKDTWDRFDYTDYKYEAFIESENGELTLVIG